MQTHIITRDHIVYSFDREHNPVRKIDPGDKICFETYDARTGTIRGEDNLLDRPHPLGANPATGPVFVRGADPGDTLRVEILEVQLASQGFIAIKAGLGNLGHLAEKYVTRLVQIEDGIVHYDDRIRFPVRPMIGVIGTAPKLADAITIACEEMANLLQQKLSVSFDDAYLLMSAIGDVRISQSCQPNQFPSTIRVVFPKIG